MNKKWYRGNIAKAVWIVVMHVAVVLMAICAVFLMDQFQKGNVPTDMGKRQYKNTEAFASENADIARIVLNGVRNDRLLEKADSNNEENIVDIKAYYESGEIVNKNENGLAYSLADIKAWSQEINRDSFYEEAVSVIVCKRGNGTYQYFTFDDFKSRIQNGKLNFIFDSTDVNNYGSEDILREEVLSSLQYSDFYDGAYNVQGIADQKGDVKFVNFWSYTDNRIDERYAPVGADSILDVVNNNEIWNGKLSEAYNGLQSILADMLIAIQNQEKLEQYSEGNTNAVYFFADKDNKKIYTNHEKYGKFKSLNATVADIRSKDSFVLLMPKLADCETTMNQDVVEWQDMLEGHKPNDISDYVFGMWVDTEFPIADEISANNANYNKYASWILPAIGVLITTVFLFLTGMVWLTIAAGRRPEDEEIHLNFFDSWFTEIAACATLAVLGCILGVGFSTSPYNAGLVILCISIIAFLGCAAGLAGYLSLIRRIKAKTLWKNSLLRWGLGWLKRFWRKAKVFTEETSKNANSILKTGLIFAVVMLVNLICATQMRYGFIWLLILVALDIYVLIHLLKRANGRQELIDGLKRITEGSLDYKIDTSRLEGEQKTVAEYINRIGDGLDAAVENSLKNERMKTELITNVSHDIKTPLTSIINYIDLLKRENFTDSKVLGYLDVLEQKAQRLKILTEDVVEASKVSTGNISLEMIDLNLVEMVHQVSGEFLEKFEKSRLNLLMQIPEESVVIRADGRRMYRVLENIFNNAAKYSLEGTRIYVDLKLADGKAILSMKNISAQPLNISADELTERFIRGDVSRGTEGSGLGLSIAKDLTELQGGEFRLYLDGDLFKVNIIFTIV